MTRDIRHAQAIALLIVKIERLERKAHAYRASVNILLEDDGLPPMYPNDNPPEAKKP